MGCIDSLDYLVINDAVEDAVEDIKAIMRAEKRLVTRSFVDESEADRV